MRRPDRSHSGLGVANLEGSVQVSTTGALQRVGRLVFVFGRRKITPPRGDPSIYIEAFNNLHVCNSIGSGTHQ